MALVSCPECGRQVSTAAASCPGCAHPMQALPAATGHAGLLGKLATVLGAWLVVPWLARALAFVAACVVAVVMFRSGRGG